MLILAGTNDLLRYPPIEANAVADALAAMVASVAARGGKAVVLTVPRLKDAEARNHSTVGPRRLALNELIRQRFDRVADVAAAFEEDDTLYDRDGLHLSKAGYAVLAKTAYPALREAMRKKAPVVR